jgi:hypothetical protein
MKQQEQKRKKLEELTATQSTASKKPINTSNNLSKHTTKQLTKGINT